MTGIILAGGTNSRIGMKKAFIEIDGKTIIDTVLNIFKDIFSEVLIVTNTPEDFYYARVKIVTDIFPGCGSLGGVYTGIKKAKYDECFVIACDMPFINSNLIKYMIKIKGYDVVVPKIKGMFEPMFAFYTKGCLEVIEKNIDKGNLRILDIFSEVNLREINDNEFRLFDNNLLSLININTLSELNGILDKNKFI